MQSSMTTAFIFADAYASKSYVDSEPDAALTRHIVEAVKACAMEGAPFPHAEVLGFLPDDVYAEALAEWPDDGVFNAVELKGSDYVGSRRAHILCDWPRVPGACALDGVWARIGKTLGSPEVVKAMFEHFSPVLDAQIATFAAAAAETPGFRMYLCRDAGVSDALGAHVDALRKLLTVVIYLDIDGDTDAESPAKWGTRLYNDQGEVNKPLDFTENCRHDTAKTVRFVRNKAFLMPNTPASLHGVAGGQPSVVRKTIMCGYWLFCR